MKLLNDKTPKILVISHNCFSESTANGRTLSSFFRQWENSRVAQIFVNQEEPNSSVCNSFFRITDKDILSSLFTFKKAGSDLGNFDFIDKSLFKNKGKTFVSKLKIIQRKFPSLLYIFRDILWSTGKWRNEKVYDWIDDFQPDLILLHPGDYSFLYKLTRVILNRKKIPLIIYNSEDYYLKDKRSFSPIFHLQRFFYKNEVKKTFNLSELVIYSNDLLKCNFNRIFNIRSTVILTSSDLTPNKVLNANKNLRFVYAGNLGHERWRSLVEIGKIIKSINNRLCIDVYSSNLPWEAEGEFCAKNGINYKGFVSYDKVSEVINNSDVVIHAEGFSNFCKWDIRHGFSTKIADLLSSGKCFLMYGPEEIACVDYLIKNKAAWVATSSNELETVLERICNSVNERERYLEDAKRLIENRHDKDKNCKFFKELMIDVYQKN